jgi:hypothetical protein
MESLLKLLKYMSFIIAKLIYDLNNLQKNIYYIKLLHFISSFKSYFYIIIKILRLSIIITLFWRLILLFNVILGVDIILAYNQINFEMIMIFFSICYNDFCIFYKDVYLQWIVDKLNSFITKKIEDSHNISIESMEDNIESKIDNTLDCHVDNPISNDSELRLKRADYKDTMLSTDSHNAFYHSPYFYIIIITSISLLGYYYFNHPLWLDYINLNNLDIDTLLGDTDLFNNSSIDYNYYFKSPEKILIDLSSAEGSPTPKASELSLPFVSQYNDPFNPIN